MISHCSCPAQHGQPTTTRLLLPTYHCQVVIGQLNTANSLQGKLTAGSQRKRQAGRQANVWAEHGPAVARGFPFSHTSAAATTDALTSGPFRVQAIRQWRQCSGCSGMAGRWWRPGVPHFYSSCHHCNGGPFSVGAVWGQ